MTIYNYNFNGIYIGTAQADEDPLEKGNYLIPAFATTVNIPHEIVQDYHSWKWNGTEWTEVVNYTNIPFWDKETKIKQPLIKEFGVEIDFDKYTTLPPIEGDWIKFEDGEWVLDPDGEAEWERQTRIKEIQRQLNELDIKKIRFMLEKEAGDLSGKSYFDEYEAETLLLRSELRSL